MQDTLMLSKDFLQLTLDNPHGLNAPFEFCLGQHTQVSVWDTGVILFEPLTELNAETKSIVLSSAVHGNETAPIELCDQLITALLSEKLITRHRVLFLIGNPPAILNGTRFVEENLNRLFSGAHSRGEGLVNQERERAKQLEQYVDSFFNAGPEGGSRYHYDLHTAIRASKHEKFAIYPYPHGEPYSGEQIMFLAACGIKTVLFHHEPTTTFSYFSAHGYQAHAFTIELGKVMPFGQNDMTRFIEVKEMLTRLVTGKALELGEFDESQVNLYQVNRSINKHFDDFSFTFSGDVENFTAFPKGYILAKEGGTEIKVEADAESIVFPNANVPVGQRTVLCLVPAKDYRVV
ncbi:succinylglutamate desuccinylase [Shewanella marisflavi]|uniref:Succinylglutamate desuccinylase n=2 Tax=Shewanella marisflavi TaxID=260364 RepID=A0AAC9TZD9_9GAMM|nr:succinylglutamate desuccinylase [Shewanella marisflavi]ASJ96836.1 succinylglutamate desuccinylase [Shewanella marisflavi]